MEVLCMDWQSGVEDFKWKYINHRHGEIIGRDAWLDPISLTVMEYSEGKIIIKKAKNNEEFSTLLDGFGKEFKIKFYSRNTLREYFKIHFENALKKEVINMNIIFVKCKRCGKQLASLNRSVWGVSDDIKKSFELCEDCITEEEKQELQNIISTAVLQKIEGGK